MKKVITVIGIFGLIFVQAQVGINTDTPNATLDIKSVGNTSKALKITNTANTEIVTVKDDGKVGIGTQNPTAKLEVNGTVKITDGTQSAGRVLTSDTDGNASWALPTTSYAYAQGGGVHDQYYPGSTMPIVNDKYRYTGMKITLPAKGKYAVNLDLALSMIVSGGVDPLLNHIPTIAPSVNVLVQGESVRVRGCFWDEILPNGIEKHPVHHVPMKNKANSMFSGAFSYPLHLVRKSNTMFIENPTTGPKTYYFYGMAEMINPQSTTTRYLLELGSGRWAEESLVAYKIGE